LGLGICAEILQAHQGRLRLGPEGQPSEFIMELPKKQR
jgi:signal transduction histidine kinase